MQKAIAFTSLLLPTSDVHWPFGGGQKPPFVHLGKVRFRPVADTRQTWKFRNNGSSAVSVMLGQGLPPRRHAPLTDTIPETRFETNRDGCARSFIEEWIHCQLSLNFCRVHAQQPRWPDRETGLQH